MFSGVFGVTIGLGTFAAFVGSGAIIAEFPFYYIFAKEVQATVCRCEFRLLLHIMYHGNFFLEGPGLSCVTSL